MPDLDIRTWIILALSAVLLAAVLLVPALRENVASCLVWIGTLLGAGATEGAQRERERQKPKPDPVTVADDVEGETETAIEEEQAADGDALAEDLNDLTE